MLAEHQEQPVVVVEPSDFRGRFLLLKLQLLEGLGQTVGIDGLEQIIQGVDLKGPDGVFVVGRDEDDLGLHVGFFQQVEPGVARHLDVQKDDVRIQPLDGLDGRGNVVGLPDDRDVVVSAEKGDQVLAGQPFVVDDESVKGFFIRRPPGIFGSPIVS